MSTRILFLKSPNAYGGGIHMTTTIQRRRFQRCYYVYILASLSGVLYVGLTDDLRHRMFQHKSGAFEGFTKKYKVDRLMHFEVIPDSKAADIREKQIKGFRREKKVALFASSNPQWKDLYSEILQTIGIPRSASGFQKKTI